MGQDLPDMISTLSFGGLPTFEAWDLELKLEHRWNAREL